MILRGALVSSLTTSGMDFRDKAAWELHDGRAPIGEFNRFNQDGCAMSPCFGQRLVEIADLIAADVMSEREG